MGFHRVGNKKHPVNRPFLDILWWHTPNQRRTETEAFFLKEMGAKAGVFDLVFIKPLVAGEVKTDTGALSTDQKRFKEAFERAGGKCFLWRSVAQMRDDLIASGLVCHNMTVFEPDLRTDEQKKKDAFDFFKP